MESCEVVLGGSIRDELSAGGWRSLEIFGVEWSEVVLGGSSRDELSAECCVAIFGVEWSEVVLGGSSRDDVKGWCKSDPVFVHTCVVCVV